MCVHIYLLLPPSSIVITSVVVAYESDQTKKLGITTEHTDINDHRTNIWDTQWSVELLFDID